MSAMTPKFIRTSGGPAPGSAGGGRGASLTQSVECRLVGAHLIGVARSMSGEDPRAPKEEPNLIEQEAGSSAFKSMLRSAGTVLGREITRSLFGTRKR